MELTRNYLIAFAALAIVYVAGLFVPLMNNDSAHHANIALHMVLTHDYTALVDGNVDYLDKPHLHFWLAALSYHVFGVNAFAYKFPSFLFALMGLYATFGLGKILYSEATGRLAALIMATAYAFVLALNDVRMDAILTACIIFSIWQFVVFIHRGQWVNLILGTLGLALGFSTKGMIGVAMPGIAIFVYLLHTRNWRMLLHWKWLAIAPLFAIFISPVLYAYYVQYDLHPEKVIHGQSNISGIKFILWSQNFERFEGTRFGNAGNNDPFFFLHTFLWAFLPWSMLCLAAYWERGKALFLRKPKPPVEGMTWLTITTIFIIISASSFKLPHYLTILFPLFAILLASYIISYPADKEMRGALITQRIVCGALLIITAFLNGWAFAPRFYGVPIVCFSGMLMWAYFQFKGTEKTTRSKAIYQTTLITLFSFFLLNFNFYPQVLTYQAGNTLADQLITNDPEAVTKTIYLSGFEHSNSFGFTLGRIIPFVDVDSLVANTDHLMIYTGDKGKAALEEKGISYSLRYQTPDYRVSRLKVSFLNPSTRPTVLENHYLLEINP